MSVTEFQRHQVFQWLEEAMGPERAAVMMDLLPPVGWGDIATSADLTVLRSELRGEIAELRGEMRAGFAGFQAELAETKASTIRTVVLAVIAANSALVAGIAAVLQI